LIKIYYFSGTGNTLWSAKRIAEIYGPGCELINIGTEARKNEIIAEAEAVVLLFPSYAYGLPVIVRRFLKKAVFKTPYAASFVTFGTRQGGALAGASRIIKRKKINSAYYGLIPAVENYIAIFGPPKEETARKRLAMQSEATEFAARCVIERRTNSVATFRPFSAFVSLLFSLGIKIFYRFYRVSSACDGCGVCEKMCPVSAVAIRENRPVFSGKCEHCNGCFNWCPQKAISFGRLRPDTPRYHHPEIGVEGMSAKN